MTSPIDSPEYAAFMDAIRAAPNADLPRLVLADWLDESGDKEAADFALFIRLQCEIAAIQATGKMRCERTDVDLHRIESFVRRCRCRSCSLRRKEWTIWSKYAHKWTTYRGPAIGRYESDIREWAANGGLRPTSQADRILFPLFPHFFGDPSRGFYSTIRTTMPIWMRYGPLAVRGPFAALERVEFSDKEPAPDISHVESETWDWWQDRLANGGTSRDLPTEIFSQAWLSGSGGENVFVDGTKWIEYRSKELALSALSTAALKFAWSVTP